jgi:glycosyltransferase involved in cell wall biosynthesis
MLERGAPPLGVVVPTRDRPESLRQAVAAIRAQEYPGPISVVIVFDGVAPDDSLAADAVRVIANSRTPGLAGARNTGILALDTELIAFCDDDDSWLPGKLMLQVPALLESGADLVSSGVAIAYDGATTVRLAGASEITHPQLLRSRMAMLHSSTFVIRREALLNTIGLVDETIPASQGEDWDLLLRAASIRPVANVDRALVSINWSAGSYFGRSWRTKIASLHWFLDHHPSIRGDRRASARIFGQLAFAHAALRERRTALSWSAKGAVLWPLEPRTYVAAAVAMGVARSEFVLDALHRRGHGI